MQNFKRSLKKGDFCVIFYVSKANTDYINSIEMEEKLRQSLIEATINLEEQQHEEKEQQIKVHICVIKC